MRLLANYLIVVGVAGLLACSEDTNFSSSNASGARNANARTAGMPDAPVSSPASSQDPAAVTPAMSDGSTATAVESSPDPEIAVEAAVASADPAQRIEREFAVAPLIEGSAELDASRGVLEQEVKLANTYEAITKEFTQITRPLYVKSYTQGNPGMNKTDTDMQNAMGVLDIVVVVDNSGSMAQEQTNLASKLSPLISAVSNSNWVINVVTTDPSNGCTFGGLIKKGDADPATAFANAVAAAGTGGSGNERGILQAVNALSCASITPAGAFPRAGSSIAVLIVADEDNCSSNGSDCPSTAYNTSAYLTNYLHDTLGRTLGGDARVYGIFWDPAVAQAQCSTGQNKATQYKAAVLDTNGVYGSICSTDYTNTLQQISTDMATILKNQFTLSADPDAGSLVVKVNNVQKTSGWSVAGRIVSFTDIPPLGSTISIAYTVGASPIRSRFALGAAPAAGSLAVTVNGAAADPASYSVDAGTNELVFSVPPPSNAGIQATFRGDVALQSDFALGAKPKSGTLTVRLNGAETNAFSVTAGGVLQLAPPPADAATISASFEAFKGKQLAYPLSLLGADIRNLAVVDADTGDAVSATYADGILTVDENDHSEARVLLVRYENELSGVKTLELPELPELDSAAVDGAPEACAAGLVVTGKSATFSCDAEVAGTLTIRYQYRDKPQTIFVLDEVTAPEAGVWEVYVDGVATSDYTRAGNAVTLTVTPAATATVKLSWSAGS